MTKLKRNLLDAPLPRTVFQVVSNVLVALFSGAFVFQISTPMGLNWSEFYSKSSFYGLLVTTAVIYFYNRAIYMREKDILKFADNEYCTAYMRSKCLPEAAEQYIQSIKSGTEGGLTKAMAELKKVLK